jgi:acetyl-CoA C-acetyltransferase
MTSPSVLSRAAAIVGVDEHPTRYAPDKSEWQLLAESARAALEEAGLKPTDVDAFFTSATAPEGGHLANSAALMMADYLNLDVDFIDETDVGGSSFGLYVNRAILGIHAGLFKCALIAYGATTSSQRVPVGTLNWNALIGKGISPTPDAFEEIFGNTVAGGVAAGVRAYASRYGIPVDDVSRAMAQVAVSARKHASLNPHAKYRDPITIDDVLNSPIINPPLHRLDCCVISDGAAALVVCSPDMVKDCRSQPIWLLGMGEAFAHSRGGLATHAEAAEGMMTRAAQKALGMADVGVQDIDTAMVYDPFTLSVLTDLESLGFCKPGEAGDFVADGGIELGGRLPVNTDGGGMSSNHPGRRGIFLFVEAVRQLRGEAGPRQVADAELAMCAATGSAFPGRRGCAVHILGA